MTFEGLTNAGGGQQPLIVVLNDNQMSISPNVGAVSMLLRTGAARSFFEALGFVYLGPVDGHDLPALLLALADAKRSALPVVVHCKTQKGRGFGPAEADEGTRGHAMGPYELRDGKLVRSRGSQRTYSDGFAAALANAMREDRKVVAVTPAMLEGSSLTSVKAEFPDRVFDVGIAEQHAVTYCAGLARAGHRPVLCIYSTFLQRSVDQVIHDVALPGLPVVFAVDRAGIVGADGATHQGAFDLGLLRPVPGLALLAPVVEGDLEPMLRWALSQMGPSVIRFPRGTLPVAPDNFPRFLGGSARWLRRAKRPELTFVALGPLALAALEAAAEEPDWSVLDVCALEPLDVEAVADAARSGRVVTAEEASVRGGLGSAIVELCGTRGLCPKHRAVALPHSFIPHGDARTFRHELGLDALGLARAARELLGRAA
jgi:1-deoxy-D-xylulose-5-phosphate synthase